MPHTHSRRPDMPGSSAPDHPPMLGAVQVVPPRSLRSLRGLHLDRPCASANLARMEEPGNNEHPSDQLDLRDNPASIKPGAVQTLLHDILTGRHTDTINLYE